MQEKKKSIAFKESHGESSTDDSDFDEDDEDLALVIRKAKKMMRIKLYKKMGFRKPNFKKDESSSTTCYECNKPGHIKKDCPILKEKFKKSKRKKALYVGCVSPRVHSFSVLMILHL